MEDVVWAPLAVVIVRVIVVCRYTNRSHCYMHVLGTTTAKTAAWFKDFW